MTRWKLVIEYDGASFVGWQRQANGKSVQSVLEDAVFQFSQEKCLVQGAGRTDSGVHALGQVAHVDIVKPVNGDTVRDAINFHLKPYSVVIRSAEAVSEDFHARFSAMRRTYLYRIMDRRAAPALAVGRVWHVSMALNADAMRLAAQSLLGHHDFTSFRAKDCQANSPMRTLDRLDVRRVNEEIHLDVEARSFLHHQVRNFAGTLKLVGEGKWGRREVEAALGACDRAAAGPTAPAQGLYLVSVGYDDAD